MLLSNLVRATAAAPGMTPSSKENNQGRKREHKKWKKANRVTTDTMGSPSTNKELVDYGAKVAPKEFFIY